ncbi:6-phosphofructokinase [Prosthecobacter fusiformis]|uniref:6-phosphofructokinase n=1 Tax=Prosthecobacter fusiformis TaxID=48464 RepID=A0A4V6Q589_9BACT|nr:6-phosphofructokinase [Prosthecobacter fusiformis]TDU64580.1 6-phosphofructokinase [Prosthecobacter fusiformis]
MTSFPDSPVAVLCSGGDAPGMNAFLRAIVRLGLNRHHVPVLGIRDGYRGLVRAAKLVNGESGELVRLKQEITAHAGNRGLIDAQQCIIQMDHASVSGIMGKGGTILGSARCMDFHKPEVRRGAIDLLEKLGVKALVVVGGDGSLTGARLLAEESSLRVIGVPATIDNDLQFTEMALGVDTAVHTLVWAVDHFIDTARSHRRVMVLETMGRESGDLARMAALASGAEMVITPESGPLTEQAMMSYAEEIEGAMTRGRGHAIVLIAEGVQFDPPQTRNGAYVLRDAFQKYFQREGAPFQDLEVRPSVLGHLQRGGHSTPGDCILAARFAEEAWKAILDPAGANGITALQHNKVQIVPFGCEDLPERALHSQAMDRLHDDLSSW